MKHRQPQSARIFVVAALFFAAAATIFGERLPVKIYTSADGLGSSFVNNVMRDSRGFMWFCTRDGLSRFDGSRFVTYQVGGEDSSPGVERIIETRDGTYWITTISGLYRLKPGAVSQPEAGASGRPTLNAEYINNWRGDLIEDRAGNLWYGGGGLHRVEERDGKVSLQKVELNLPPQPERRFGVAGIVEAADGSLWLNASWGAVRRLPDGRTILYSLETTVRQGFTSLKIDAEGRVWLVRNFEFFVIKPETAESLAGLGQATVKPLVPTYTLPANLEKEIRLPQHGGEILGFTGGDFLTKHQAHRLFQTADNHVWLTTDAELIEFDGSVFHRFDERQGLPAGLFTMAEDAAGNLWIGGRTGLVRLDRKGLKTFLVADGLNSNALYGINESADGTLYLVDNDFYLSRFTGKDFQTVRPSLDANPKALWTSRYAFLDSRNQWWILTSEKLYRFAASDLSRPLATYTSKDGLKADEMYQMFEDKSGGIWVSVQPGENKNLGLARFDSGENKFYTFGEAENFPSGKSASSFAEDAYGNIWMGFYEGGLARYRDGHFTIYTNNLPEDLLTDLHMDRAGRLWIASASGGLVYVDDTSAAEPQFNRLTSNEGLSSNNVRTLTEDHFGNIYAGTVRGVDRISPDLRRIKHYTIGDGLASDFVTDSHCDKSGALWFATTNGLSRLIPLRDENAPAPSVWLGGLRIAGVAQPLSELGDALIETAELDSTQNNLQLDFFGMDFRAGEILRYQYKLEGADTDWSLPSSERTVNFSNLSAGTYRFLVRAVNSEGAASERPAAVSFVILAPIWARWWFIAITILFGGALLYSLYRYRTARLREVNFALAGANRAELALLKSREERLAELEKIRSRIAVDLHDDIGASLTQIAVLSEVAQTQNGNGGNGKISVPLQSISKVSNELVETMSDIVWSINPAKDHLHDLTQRMRRFASDVLSAKGISFQFLAPILDDDISIGTNLRREVFLIFKEAVNNMVKHSNATHAQIELEIFQRSLILRISDDGDGFQTELPATTDEFSFDEQTGGNGLSSMRRRAADTGGELKIISANGAGTQILLRLPLETAAQAGGAAGA
jgi:signal transduction histidine kinase/ligand-binding sensor domain-containing protein